MVHVVPFLTSARHSVHRFMVRAIWPVPIPDIIAAIHSYVSRIPTARGVEGFHPSRCWIRVLSEFLPRTPLGASTLYRRTRRTSAISSTMSTRWLIDTSSLEPMLMGSRISLSMIRLIPSMQSSMYMKDRVWRPSPPDLDLRRTGELRLDNFPADGCWGLLSAAVVGAVGAVDVVEASDARLEAEVFAEVATHPFGEELFPPVPVLRHGRIGIFLAERSDVRQRLLVGGVDTGRAAVEVRLNARIVRCKQEVRVDEYREHAVGLVALDEAHPAHVGSQVVDARHPGHGLPAVGQVLEVEPGSLPVRGPGTTRPAA